MEAYLGVTQTKVLQKVQCSLNHALLVLIWVHLAPIQSSDHIPKKHSH